MEQHPFNCDHPSFSVMPGLDPGIHENSLKSFLLRVDGRVKPGHDGVVGDFI